VAVISSQLLLLKELLLVGVKLSLTSPQLISIPLNLQKDSFPQVVSMLLRQPMLS
jgi:hypothetical protein